MKQKESGLFFIIISRDYTAKLAKFKYGLAKIKIELFNTIYGKLFCTIIYKRIIEPSSLRKIHRWLLFSQILKSERNQ